MPLPGLPLPRGVAAQRVWDEPQLLRTGPDHALAGRTSVTLAELADHPVWMPSIVAGTEWAVYYGELARTFQITVDSSGSHFGRDAMRDALTSSPRLATFASSAVPGESGDGLELIELRDPIPVYPHSLVWHEDNHHPTLERLRLHLADRRGPAGDTWCPG